MKKVSIIPEAIRTVLSAEKYKNAGLTDLKEQNLCRIGGIKLHHPW